MILLLHGISQQEFVDKQDDLKEKWFKLLGKGLKGVGASEEEIQSIVGSSRMLFYADITDPDRKWEKENTKAVGVEAYESSLRREFDQFGEVRGPQNTWIAHLIAKWADSFPVIRDGLLRALAKEAYGFFGNPKIAEELDARCDEFIGDDRFKIIIGHSFGSVVGYRLLARKPGIADHFITIGSPLGSPFFQAKLRMKYQPTFKTLKTWSDFRDKDDIVAYREIEIESMFSDYSTEPPKFSTTHEKIHNRTFNEHSIQGYLAQKQVSEKILEIHRRQG